MQEAPAGAPPPSSCDVLTPHVQESDDEEISSDTDLGFVGSPEPSKEDYVAELLIQQLGGSSRFVREQRQTARRLVSEIYSPPRITKEIVEGKWKHVAPGFALPHGERSPRWTPLGLQPR